ncbi:alpha/beta fold hydrolase [Arthrobacter sp. zg-Y820]|uniref:alpha/beta fold hydrolase n=1 Tax=unclassified Arthrobacter TaxID=235627 RepID=UPI001E3E1D55|nr:MULTISPECIES: alpha/beta fold hydrolase [unclassified Arthrobacter]MCC9196958.1 alpha/beta fold hydrolase [Arthrobacter sp. zg-Y820]MDK1279823.1 alpha/beta fold hydrolase [Arthrobacter sp. zg.Y820]WIB10926.1 alpha/beta fold hydrolase [Arthrobacter sp. zg-Y820]
MSAVHHRFATIEGRRIFYREAGSPESPTVVLLHGYPTSSAMYRNLIPLLADRYHVVAPDHLGFGLSDAPSVDEFSYSFDALARITSSLLASLEITKYAIVVQDYGAPIGWRLALEDPSAITAIISQNGNAYEEGFVESFWKDVWAYARAQTPQTEAAVRAALTREAIRWQYVTGVADPTLVDPGTWERDASLIGRPGNDLVQLALFRNYASNIPLYPRLHEYFRSTQVPLLAVWGQGDEIFGSEGAHAFSRDLPNAHIELHPGGHFLLESGLEAAAAVIRSFLSEVGWMGNAVLSAPPTPTV